MINGINQVSSNTLNGISPDVGIESSQGLGGLDTTLPKDEFSLIMNELSQSNVTVEELESLNVNQFLTEEGSLDIEQLLNYLRQNGKNIADKPANIDLAEEETLLAQSAAIVSGEQQVALKANHMGLEGSSGEVANLSEKQSQQLANLKGELIADSQTNGQGQFKNQTKSEANTQFLVDESVNNAESGQKEVFKQQFESVVDMKSLPLNDVLSSVKSSTISKIDANPMATLQAPSVNNLGAPQGAQLKSLAIAQSVGQTDWVEGFNEKILWMTNQQIKSAAIKLSPIELGPIEVSISMSKENATIQFNSHSPQVRELIEQALPKLREMMGEQGVNLADVNVSGNNSQHQAQENHRNSPLMNESTQESVDNLAISSVSTRASTGLIDYFA
jgi:flagellar hook-length control protein FliK